MADSEKIRAKLMLMILTQAISKTMFIKMQKDGFHTKCEDTESIG